MKFKLLKQAVNQGLGVFGYELYKPKPGYHIVRDIYGKNFHKIHDIRDYQPFGELAAKAIADGRTLLYYDRLYNLFQSLEQVITHHPGASIYRMLEIGVYKGGGSYFLASAANALAPGRVEMFSIDTFEGHSVKDLPKKEGKHSVAQFNDTSYESVSDYLSAWPFLKTVKNRFEDAVPHLPEGSWHFVHLDVDIYAPTLHALRYFRDRLVHGGIIIVDDYNYKSCPGAKKAVQEFLAEAPGEFVRFELPTGQCMLCRIRQ